MPGVPFALRWDVAPVAWHLDADGRLTVQAGARTDLFIEPGDVPGTPGHDAAPRLLGVPPAPAGRHWRLTAKVTVGSRGSFDAAVLLVWVDGSQWAKLCLEVAPDGDPMIVSVVTNGVSDDANAWSLAAGEGWLRISSLGRDVAFHASENGETWQFVRHFSLGAAATRVGFLAQSPVGEGCTATFEQVRFEPGLLSELRNGD